MMKLQEEYCKEHNLPFFAPSNGVCWSCNRIVPDTKDEHITGCPHCNSTYCD